MTQLARLVLLRHGQSEWNASGIFAGWENAHLTAQGKPRRPGPDLRPDDLGGVYLDPHVTVTRRVS